MDSARKRGGAEAARPETTAALRRRRPETPADRLLAMQRGAGNHAVARMLARTVTLPNDEADEPEVVPADRIKSIVEGKLKPGLLPDLDAEVEHMAGPDFAKKDFLSEQKLVSAVVDRLEARYMRAIAMSHPKATEIATKCGGVNTLAWSVTLTKFPADLEELLVKLGPVVEADDLDRQMKDVFGKGEAMAPKLAGGGANWIKGKQTQVNGLIAELRIAGKINPESLAESTKMNFGKKYTADVPVKKSEGEGESSAEKTETVSVKADLSYTDSSGVLWFVEIAEGVEGLRKKVTRLDAHQRSNYQAVAKSKDKTAKLKYVCVTADGWMKLCNLDKKNPSPVSEMAKGGWILELAGVTLTTEQLELAGHNALLLYGNYTADTIGKRYRRVWSSLTAFAADTDPVSAFTLKTQLEPDLSKTGETVQ